MNLTTRILTAISSTEPTTFGELCRGLGSDKPESRDEWRQFFLTLDSFEESKLVEIERDRNDRIETLILTDVGAERAREALKAR
jgi:hypothetical protein